MAPELHSLYKNVALEDDSIFLETSDANSRESEPSTTPTIASAHFSEELLDSSPSGLGICDDIDVSDSAFPDFHPLFEGSDKEEDVVLEVENDGESTVTDAMREEIDTDFDEKGSIDATGTGRLYHEKQEWEFCLMHALNALFQREKFTTNHMDAICNTLAPDKLINPHKSIFRTGNYDANVLMMALHQEDVDVQWFDSRKAQSDLSLNEDFLCPKEKYAEFLGFIVNIQQKKMFVFNRRHWLTIKRIEGVWYNLDSKNEDAEPWKEEELLKWLKSACKNDAQLMICRKKRVQEMENLKENFPEIQDGNSAESASSMNLEMDDSKVPEPEFCDNI